MTIVIQPIIVRSKSRHRAGKIVCGLPSLIVAAQAAQNAVATLPPQGVLGLGRDPHASPRGRRFQQMLQGTNLLKTIIDAEVANAIPPSGVTAGTYTQATVTISSAGVVTAASSNPLPSNGDGSLTFAGSVVSLNVGHANRWTANVGFFGAAPVPQQTGDLGAGLAAFGLFSGTPTFAAPNLTGNLNIAQFNGGAGATSFTSWRGDGRWSGPVTNDVTGQTATVDPLVPLTAATGTPHQYQIGGYICITAYTGGGLKFSCTFMDEKGTARTVLLGVTVSALGFFLFSSATIMVQPNTALKIAVIGSGFVGTFDAGGNITQLN